MSGLGLKLYRSISKRHLDIITACLVLLGSTVPIGQFLQAQTLGQDNLGGAGLGSTGGIEGGALEPVGQTFLQSEEELEVERQDSAAAAAAELQLATSEIVAGKVGGIALGLGNSQPWQLLSLEATYRPAYFASRTVTVGLTTGGGTFKDSTTAEEQSLDLDFSTKSFGVLIERSLLPFEHLTVGLGSGFSTFEGTVDPHGRPRVDSTANGPINEAPDSGVGLLQRDISANGWWLSAYVGLQWIFGGRYTVVWRPFGVRLTKLLTGTFDEPIQKSAKQRIEAPSLYGVTNLTIGVAF